MELTRGKAYPKFKIGDRVVMVRSLHPPWGPPVGTVAYIEGVDCTGLGNPEQINYELSTGSYVHEQELELAPE